MSSSSDVLAVLRERGFIQQITEAEELAAQAARGPLTVYAGFDPTAPSLHVGHLLPLVGLAHFARMGHTPIAVLGGGTALVGDPTGRTEMRQMLTAESIASNRGHIDPQVRRMLASAGDRAIVVDNAEWLGGLGYLEFLREIGRHFSVNRMLTADAYRARLEKGLSFIEFNYQILQAYDFLVLWRRYGCHLQVGGDDQWSNMLAGTDLIRRCDQGNAFALTFPLITTASGAKMGKTAAGAVWLAPEMTSPFDFFQYFVNVDDRDVGRFLRLFTFVEMAEVRRLEALCGAELRHAKAVLAYEVTRIVHGDEAAAAARDGAKAAFGGSGLGADVPTHLVASNRLAQGYKIVDLLAEAGLAESKSAARRLVAQGGVRVGDRKVSGVDDLLKADEVPAAGVLLHAGKKHVRRLVVDKAPVS